MNVRRCARAVVINEHGHILLYKFSFHRQRGDKVFWVTPGGGLLPGESYEDALRRELLEETGLHIDDVGPWLWTREVPIDDGDQSFVSHERLYLIKVDGLNVSLENMDQQEYDTLRTHRWWDAARIASSSESFSPPNMAELLQRVLNDELPDRPELIP